MSYGKCNNSCIVNNLKRTLVLIAALLVVLTCTIILTGCGNPDSGAEARVIEDLESMRYVELDPAISAELDSILTDTGKEYFEMFLGKAGEFEYEILGADSDDDRTVVHVRITTYDFASEYLKSWSEFLETSTNKPGDEGETAGVDDQQDSAVAESEDAGEDPQEEAEEEKDESQSTEKAQYDTATLYETLFRNLSNVQKKDYTANVDVNCIRTEDGRWATDAGTNAALRNAILGGMVNEIAGLAE